MKIKGGNHKKIYFDPNIYTSKNNLLWSHNIIKMCRKKIWKNLILEDNLESHKRKN
jgi:hypothetical protein